MERHEQLRTATRRAVAAWSAERAGIDAAPRTPRPGDTFVFPGSGDLLVEWLVIEEGADGRLLVVAVDDRSGAGSRDVALDPSVSGLASVRCAVEARLHTAAFESARRTGTLADDVLAQVLKKRASLADGSVVASPAEQEVDDDSGYRSRMAELGELRDVLAGTAAWAKTVAFAKKPLVFGLVVLGVLGGTAFALRRHRRVRRRRGPVAGKSSESPPSEISRAQRLMPIFGSSG